MPIDHDDRSIKNIILFGEALVDIFPDSAIVGGAPFNVGHHLQSFGLHPILITRTGTDSYHQKLAQHMRDAGMTTSGIQRDPHYPTGQVLVKFSENGHEFEILADQAYDFIDPLIVGEVTASTHPDLVYFGTLAQRNWVSGTALEELLRRAPQAPRLLDINLRKPWYNQEIVQYSLTQADYVKVNEDELTELPRLLGMQTGNTHDIASRLIQDFRLKTLLVTCGAEGAWLLDQNEDKVKTPGIKDMSIIDTVGAGDGFSAVFILGTLFGWPNALILERANRFAAALCSIRGAIPESPEFYYAFLKEWDLPTKTKR